jgi:transcription elongation factor GreA
VVFGATVNLESDSGEEVVFQIVGESEADVRLGLVSISSPIARALVGKVEGDEVDVAVPGGTRTFEIVSVRYL